MPDEQTPWLMGNVDFQNLVLSDWIDAGHLAPGEVITSFASTQAQLARRAELAREAEAHRQRQALEDLRQLRVRIMQGEQDPLRIFDDPFPMDEPPVAFTTTDVFEPPRERRRRRPTDNVTTPAVGRPYTNILGEAERDRVWVRVERRGHERGMQYQVRWDEERSAWMIRNPGMEPGRWDMYTSGRITDYQWRQRV